MRGELLADLGERGLAERLVREQLVGRAVGEVADRLDLERVHRALRADGEVERAHREGARVAALLVVEVVVVLVVRGGAAEERVQLGLGLLARRGRVSVGPIPRRRPFCARMSLISCSDVSPKFL